jgi:hypothetical protein
MPNTGGGEGRFISISLQPPGASISPGESGGDLTGIRPTPRFPRQCPQAPGAAGGHRRPAAVAVTPRTRSTPADSPAAATQAVPGSLHGLLSPHPVSTKGTKGPSWPWTMAGRRAPPDGAAWIPAGLQGANGGPVLFPGGSGPPPTLRLRHGSTRGGGPGPPFRGLPPRGGSLAPKPWSATLADPVLTLVYRGGRFGALNGKDRRVLRSGLGVRPPSQQGTAPRDPVDRLAASLASEEQAGQLPFQVALHFEQLPPEALGRGEGLMLGRKAGPAELPDELVSVPGLLGDGQRGLLEDDALVSGTIHQPIVVGGGPDTTQASGSGYLGMTCDLSPRAGQGWARGREAAPQPDGLLGDAVSFSSPEDPEG